MLFFDNTVCVVVSKQNSSGKDSACANLHTDGFKRCKTNKAR